MAVLLETAPDKLIELGLEKIKKVRLINLLGTGNFGEVWKVVDVKTNNIYALKVISFNRPANAETIKRIELEAGVNVDSEYVVSALGLRVWDERTFLILFEYFEGEALDKVIKKNVLSDEEKRSIYNQILFSIDDIHRHNIIHRDLKTANFLVSPTGKVRLIDFGIAKFSDSFITQIGAVLGSPAYLAPESLFEGSKTADARVDIYSLGHILYELETNIHFWERQKWTSEKNLLGFMAQSPAPTEIILLDDFNGNLYPDSKNILKQMVKIEPNERFGSVVEIITALGIKRERQSYIVSALEIPFLIVESGTNHNAQLPIHVTEDKPHQYGRLDIAGNDSSISRKHIEFSKKANKYFVRDLGSKHGTLLNGNLLTIDSGWQEIKHDDGIKLGDIFLRFEFIS